MAGRFLNPGSRILTNLIGGIFPDGFESADIGVWSSANPP
jgi:hypothetical protein